MAGKKTTKTNTKSTSKKKTAEDISAKKQLNAIIFFALGIIFTALALITGESLWESLHYMTRGLFGWCSYLIGPVFIYLAVMNTLEKSAFSTTAQGIESAVLILLLSGVTTVLNEGMELSGNVFDKIGMLYTNGKELIGGGVISTVCGLTFIALMGRVAAVIVSFVLIALVLMLITGTTLRGLADNTKKVGKKVKEVYVEQVEQRKAVEAEKRAAEAERKNFQIDIPLDGEPVRYQNASTEEAVNRSKEKLLGKKEQEKPAELPQKKIETSAAMASGTMVFENDTGKEPIHGFKVVSPSETTEKRQPVIDIPLDDDIGSARTEKKSAPVSIDIPLDDVKSAEEQMAEAAKDPQLEALINRAMEQKASSKEAKEAARAIADEEQQKITEIMDDLETIPYVYPDIELLKESKKPDSDNVTEELRQNADTLVNTLQSFGVTARVVDISRGPAVTRYELQPGAGVKISKIAGLADDIALNLAAAGVRIEAPIPNKAAVGIEVPNKNVSTVSIREIIDSDEFRAAKSKLTVALGRDITGKVVVADLSKMPHLLIAGSTGSGKSVCINSMLISLLYKSSPDEVKLLLVDPKVVELGVYNGIPHLLIPVVTDPRKAAGALNWAVSEMLKRYKMFADTGVRDISGFNELAETRDDLQKMPRVVIVIDELADLMMAASGEVEDAICRLAQMARAAGMHLVVATQRPSVDVITGLIKANISSRIAFAVSSQIDSRTILEHGGAEKLLGRGDMLFNPMGVSKPSRVQGCFVSDREVEDVVKYVKNGGTAVYDEDILDDIEKLAAQEKGKKSADVSGEEGGGFSDEDEMLPAAIECVVEMGQASTSLLQRKLKLGYARAARIIDQMEERGIVGPFEGSKPRQVLISKEQWLEMKLGSDEQ